MSLTWYTSRVAIAVGGLSNAEWHMVKDMYYQELSLNQMIDELRRLRGRM